jgi:hypothetical protein
MNAHSAEMARLLARAAEMRAGGLSWERVAAKVGRSVATCRRWPYTHASLWRRAYAIAARERFAEAGAEGLQILREMLRSAGKDVRQNVAKVLAALGRPRPPRSVPRQHPPADPWQAAFEELSDVQLRKLLDSVRALLAARERPAVAE